MASIAARVQGTIFVELPGLSYDDESNPLPEFCVGDGTLGAISGLRLLQSLRLTECPRVTGAGLESVGLGCSLHSLALTSCVGLTDKGLGALPAAVLPQLRHLDLQGVPFTHELSNQGIGSLFAACPNLCKGLTLPPCFAPPPRPTPIGSRSSTMVGRPRLKTGKEWNCVSM